MKSYKNLISEIQRLQTLATKRRRKEVGGVLVRRVTLTSAGSLYRSLGDWVPWGAVGAVLGAWMCRLFVDRRKRGA